ncbi:sugar phosphate isomerase/epimerase [Candidatus Bathyarchaeota archaeon]|nr:sugar phosphate isomerase/epimerase [Candidatus Bathyarchaeota archaeon]
MSREIVAVGLKQAILSEGGEKSLEQTKFDERIVVNVTGCFAGYELFDALNKAEELGFQSVAVMPGPKAKHSLGELTATLNFYEADEARRRRIKKAMSRFKRISIHQAWDSEWRKWIDCAAYLGAEIVTVHAGTRKKEELLEQFLKRQVQFFRQIGDYARSKGIKIGVENEGGKYGDYVSLIKAIKHPLVGATIDVGHCAYFDEVKSISYMGERAKKLNEVICRLARELGKKIYHFHVHNVQPYEQVDFSKIPSPYWKSGSLVDHRCAADGEIDFPRLFRVLKECGYSGMFELELEEPDMEAKTVRSGEYLNELLTH